MSVLGQYIAKTQAIVSQFFGISPNTVEDWRQRGMPGVRGRYDLAECAQWHRAWMVERIKGNGQAATEEDGDEDSRAELEKQKLREDIKMKKLKRAEMEGRLVDRLASKAAVMQEFHRARARFLAVPEELGTSLPSELRSDFVADAKQKVHQILKSLAVGLEVDETKD